MPEHANGNVWVRDLTEEGIEPHPGPRFLSKNMNGLCHPARRESVYRKIRQEHARDPIGAVLIQEHHWHREVASAAQKQAASERLLLIASPIPENETKGGTAIIIPWDAIELHKGETLHDGVQRLQNSASTSRDGRITSISTLVHGKKVRITSAYAHSDEKADARPKFFKEDLKTRLTSNTILGIDANTVPDESIDLKRVGVGPYNNKGATELADAVSHNGLIDVARECLGREPFYTSHHNVEAGADGQARVTHTRIDQMYAPDINGLIWQHEPLNDPFIDTRRKELDHSTVAIRIDEAKGERGNDLVKINEDIYDSASFLAALASHITYMIQLRKPGEKGTWGDTWMEIKKNVLEMSKKETKRKAYKDNKQTRQLKSKRDALKKSIDTGVANASEIAEYIQIGSQISTAIRDERSLYDTVEDVAYSTGKRPDVGSAAMYRPYKPKGSAQWVNETAEADWTNISAPVFNGNTCKDASKQAEAATPYWSALFTKRRAYKASAIKCLRLLRHGKRVLAPSAAKCGAPVTASEIRDVCNTLPTGKSPGPDRIPNKFYKHLSSVVAPIIAEVANESKSNKKYPTHFSDGIIALLYKKRK